jgi:hypothetical protein
VKRYLYRTSISFVTHSIKQAAKNCVQGYRLAALIAIIGLTLILTAYAQNSETQSFSLAPASDTIAACLPNAAARVTVFSKEDIRGVDTLDLKAEGLPPKTSFAVFLTELPEPPFGATQYIGDFTTNAAGRGSLRVDAIVEDAFSSVVVGGVRVRKDLNHVVFWFADPAADDSCFAPGTGPTTPFDGDGQAGAAAMSSRNFLPGAPLP